MIELGHRAPARTVDVVSLAGPALLALLGAIVLHGQLGLELAGGVIIADLCLVALMMWWIIVGKDDLGRQLGRALLGPLLLILLGTLIAMTHVGSAEWAVRDLVLDIAAVLGFLATAAVAGRLDQAQWVWVRRFTVVSLGLVVAQLITEGGGELRSAAGFPNPNLAAHFVVTMTAVAMELHDGRRTRTFIGVLGVLGWMAAGSFGALLQAVVMVAYRYGPRVGPSRLAGAAVIGSVAAVGAAWLALTGSISRLTFGGVSTDRLGRSSDGRFAKWIDGLEVFGRWPTGVGPGSVKELGLSDNELHNEPLAYLVERGPLALLGLVLFYLVLWSLARPGGRARMLVLGFAAASLFRETSHYRHLWLGLALLLAWERFGAPGERTTAVRRVRSTSPARVAA